MPDDAIIQTADPVVSSSPALLAAQRLCFDKDGRHLIDQVDLKIQAGRRCVIMGANGAGKSLLLRLLHGLLPHSAGELLWHGRPVDRTARLAQAMVFQRPVMLRRSVIANLRFALSVRGIRGAERKRRMEEALEYAQLADLARRPARVLSGGEQQRLAVARAIICYPEILFLDEPTASLDPASTHAIERLVLETNRRGTTIVMVTHDRGQARRMGEDLLFMHEGRVVETGLVSEVLDSPRSGAVHAWLEGRLYFSAGKNSGSHYHEKGDSQCIDANCLQ